MLHHTGLNTEWAFKLRFKLQIDFFANRVLSLQVYFGPFLYKLNSDVSAVVYNVVSMCM